jgi:hypothetical protein
MGEGASDIEGRIMPEPVSQGYPAAEGTLYVFFTTEIFYVVNLQKKPLVRPMPKAHASIASCYVNLQEKKKPLPLSSTLHRFKYF